MVITYTTYGVKQINARFNRMIAAVSNWKPAWNQIAKDFYAVEKDQFASEGGRKSSWKPLSPKYAAYKAKRYPGTKILERTGGLKRSLTGASGPQSVFDSSPQELRIGADSQIGSFHFHGTAKMPARRPIDLTRKDKSRWIRYMRDYMAVVARTQR